MTVCSCKSQFELLLNSNDADEKYEAAFQYYNEGKYTRSAALFESLSILTNGTERDDTVKFYWGLSNYKSKDYYTAETNFDKFLEVYPRSPFASEARYLRLECLYKSTLRWELDQAPTYKTISEISEYILDHPDNPNMKQCKDMLDELNLRLDRKSFEAAKLYYKMEDYLAARVAFRNVLKDKAENAYREDILYYIAISSYKYANLSVASKQKERFLVFIDDYYNLIGEIPDSRYRKELDVVYHRAQKALGKDAVVNEYSDFSEKDFAKERKLEAKEQKKSAKK